MIQADLAAVGINMQLEVVEFGTLYQGLQDGQHDAFLYGITYWMAEPWNQLSLIHQTGQFSNWGRYSNPALDELMTQADKAPTFDERKPIYDEVQIALSEEQAFVYLYHEIYANGAPHRGPGRDRLHRQLRHGDGGRLGQVTRQRLP